MTEYPGQIQQIPPDQVYPYLHSRREGLIEEEVRERLLEVGKNSFEVPEKWKRVRSFFKQFTNFFTILLIVSALICFIAHRINPGESMNILGWALLGVSLLNALFSFFQEYRAERAMEELKKFLPRLVEVLRNAEILKIPAEEIVPGDVILVAEGDKISADARIVESDGLMVDNAPLTGESIPCVLHSNAVQKPLTESDNILLAGCTVVRGSGKAVVFSTGLRTEFGKLAHLSQAIRRSASPLEKETGHMVRVLTVIAVLMGLGFFFYGVLSGRGLWINLVFMMGIIVANVPEGLLPTFTLALAIGSLRMARKNVLVKSLNAVEALGAVHVICSDKTGTLTRNRLVITKLADPVYGSLLTGGAELFILQSAMTASTIRTVDTGISGDPLDIAVAHKYKDVGGEFERMAEAVLHHFPFDIEKRRSAGIFVQGGQRIFAVKGAFEAIRPMITRIGSSIDTCADIAGGSIHGADEAALDDAESILIKMAEQGLRVIAVACRLMDDDECSPDSEGLTEEQQGGLERDLVLIGFIGIEDPVRDEVPAAVKKCHTAGIDVIMITGDHPDTALALAVKSGIVTSGRQDRCITGDRLERMSEERLSEELTRGVRVFARTTPAQKMKIVAALKTMEKVVAMTGDGVNDAPALKAADIGIAMGLMGTDVARESAQIILLDDNFASIVDGIEEGRTVFENIKKFTNYVLVSNGPEILPYLLYIILPVPLALNVLQILSIDLGTDIVPSMALGQEPPDPEVMRRPPRARAQNLLTPGLIIHSYLFLGLLEGGWSLFLFFYVLKTGGWHYGTDLSFSDPLYRSATGIALSTILLMQIGNLLGRRFSFKSGLDFGIFRNKLMLLGIVIQVVFSWGTLYFPPLQRILNTGPVSLSVYCLAWVGIPLIFGADYFRKRIMVSVW